MPERPTGQRQGQIAGRVIASALSSNDAALTAHNAIADLAVMPSEQDSTADLWYIDPSDSLIVALAAFGTGNDGDQFTTRISKLSRVGGPQDAGEARVRVTPLLDITWTLGTRTGLDADGVVTDSHRYADAASVTDYTGATAVKVGEVEGGVVEVHFDPRCAEMLRIEPSEQGLASDADSFGLIIQPT